jgi:two-component system response regulator WspF
MIERAKPGTLRPLRTGIASSMETSACLLRYVVERELGWEIAWQAHDGDEAVRLCAQDTPDLIFMDIPGKSGVLVTREIMASTPCAILIITSCLDNNRALVFEALSAGALDAVDTPQGTDQHDLGKLLAKVKSIAKLLGQGRPTSALVETKLQGVALTLVAIGASTGGPAALRTLLEQLPAEFPAAVVIAQHLDEKFSDGMAEWLSSFSRLPVTVANPGERPEAGRVLLAGTNDHLVLQENGTLIYTAEPIDQPYRPSVDEFFASVALYWKGPIVGILLTGMGQDGARGLLALRRLGYLTLAQDQESSIVYGMPGTAARFGAAMAQMNPAEIGMELVRIIPGLQAVVQKTKG